MADVPLSQVFGDPDAPEFASIRTRLALAYLEHKADLGVPLADDEEIIKRVDEITMLLLDRAATALRVNNTRWLERYQWFAEIADALSNDQPHRWLDA